MARARNIKPGFFMNDRLAEVESLGRLLFAGLWTIADREGRLEDRPKKIKAAVLPYDDCDIEKLLNALSPEFIIRYSVDGKNYIQIVNFLKHQNPHPREVSSIIPAIPCEGNTQAMPRHDQGQTLQLPGNADSPIPLILIAESPTPSIAMEVLKHWNNQLIIVHRELTEDMEKAIDKAVKETSIEEVMLASEHFGIMLNDKDYGLCDYKWDLATFLSRKLGYKQFLNDGAKWINYQEHIRNKASPTNRRETAEERMARIKAELEAEENEQAASG